jgi:hypothetical protein
MRTPRLRLRGLRCGSAVALLVLAGALFVPSRPADAQLLPLISRLAGPFAGHQHQPNEPLNDQGGLGHGAEARHFPLLLPLQDSMIDFDGPRRASAAAPGDFDQHGATVRPSAKSDADVPETSKNIWEVVVGSCAGGAFLGSFSAVTAAGAAAAPVAAASAAAAATVVAPIAASAIAVAAGSGCVMGIATAVVSLSAIEGWHLLGE